MGNCMDNDMSKLLLDENLPKIYVDFSYLYIKGILINNYISSFPIVSKYYHLLLLLVEDQQYDINETKYIISKKTIGELYYLEKYYCKYSGKHIILDKIINLPNVIFKDDKYLLDIDCKELNITLKYVIENLIKFLNGTMTCHYKYISKNKLISPDYILKLYEHIDFLERTLDINEENNFIDSKYDWIKLLNKLKYKLIIEENNINENDNKEENNKNENDNKKENNENNNNKEENNKNDKKIVYNVVQVVPIAQKVEKNEEM